MKKEISLFIMIVLVVEIVYLILNIKSISLQEQTQLSDKRLLQIEKIIQIETTINDVIDQIKGTGPKTLARGTTIKRNKNDIIYDYSGKLISPLTIMLLGDSNMLEGYGPALESDLIAKSEINVVRVGKYSTGLNNIAYYDWYTTTEELITIHKPDIIVMMIGANDGQAIVDDQGNSVDFYTDQWSIIYADRINKYLTKFSSKVKKIYWVGLSMPRRSEDQKKYQKINNITKKSIEGFASSTISFIDNWGQFTINNVYSNVITNQNNQKIIVKQSDGIHLTVEGGKYLSYITIREMEKDINFDFVTK